MVEIEEPIRNIAANLITFSVIYSLSNPLLKKTTNKGCTTNPTPKSDTAREQSSTLEGV
jgi:hypothetical protein